MSLAELKKLRQWCCSKSKDDKSPRQVDGKRASVTDPSTWNTYDECKKSGMPFAGFVLTQGDDYAVIDLDGPKENEPLLTDEQLELQAQIKESANSYTEVSTSGNGAHIVVKGSIPHGVRRDKVEVYSSERYIILTEKAVDAKPVSTRQELLSRLYFEMGGTSKIELPSVVSTVADDAIIALADRASNGRKFRSLYEGILNGYPSQSEADYALLSILNFYTQDDAQIMRLFRASNLGKRQKAQRDKYLLDSINKIRANKPNIIDTSDLIAPKTKDSPFCLSYADALQYFKTPPTWLVDGIIAEKSCGFIGAPPKQGKTWLALDLCVAMSTGGEWLGRQVVKGKPLYVAGEGGGYFLLQRMAKLAAGRGIDHTALDVLIRSAPVRLDMPSGIAALREAIELHKPSLAIFDPMTRMRVGREVTEEVEPMLSDLRRVAEDLGTAILIVHHSPKPSRDKPFDPLRGAQSFFGWADFVVGLKPTPQKGTSLITTELRDAPAIDPFLVSVECGLSDARVLCGGDMPQKETLGDRIISTLTEYENGLTLSSLADLLGRNKNATKKELLIQLAAKKVSKNQKGAIELWSIRKQEKLELGES